MLVAWLTPLSEARADPCSPGYLYCNDDSGSCPVAGCYPCPDFRDDVRLDYYNRYWPHSSRDRHDYLRENDCAVRLPMENLARLIDRLAERRLGGNKLNLHLMNEHLRNLMAPGQTRQCYNEDNSINSGCCYYRADGVCQAPYEGCRDSGQCDIRSSTGELLGRDACNIQDDDGTWVKNPNCCRFVTAPQDGSGEWECIDPHPGCDAECPDSPVLVEAILEPTRHRVLHGSWNLSGHNDPETSTDDVMVFDVPIRLREWAFGESDTADRWIVRLLITFVDRTQEELVALEYLWQEAPRPPTDAEYAGWFAGTEYWNEMCTEAVVSGTNLSVPCGFGALPPFGCWEAVNEVAPTRLRPIDWLNVHQDCEPGTWSWGTRCSRHLRSEQFPGFVILSIDLLPDPQAPDPVNQDPILRLLGSSPGWALSYLPSGIVDRLFDFDELQDRLREQFATVLDQQVQLPLPGAGSVSLGLLMRNSGGARVSDEALDILIPGINYESDSANLTTERCTHQSAFSVRDGGLWHEMLPEVLRPWAGGFNIGDLLDWPKLIHNVLGNQRIDLEYSVANGPFEASHRAEAALAVLDSVEPRVYCNVPLSPLETRSCEGKPDRDGDGFCDELDYCPDLFTGSNCDFDLDGVGDGARESGRCQLVQQLQEKHLVDPVVEQMLRRELCGGCDLCYDVDDRLHGADRDGDGLGDYRGYNQHGNEVQCDLDLDGDGAPNDQDCDPRNPLVTLDVDQDGVCEYGMAFIPGVEDTVNAFCLQKCQELADAYGDNLNGCRYLCRRDNCIEAASPLDAICPFGAETRDPECLTVVLPTPRCPYGWRTPRLGSPGAWRYDPAIGAVGWVAGDFCLNRGEDSDLVTDECPEAWRTRIRECARVQRNDFCTQAAECLQFDSVCLANQVPCNTVFGNQQGDDDQDGIGDKCDRVNSGTVDFSSRLGGLTATETEGQVKVVKFGEPGTIRTVAFNAWGGEATLTGSWPNPEVVFNPEVPARNNFQIGACYCDFSTPSGDWDERCNDRCPTRTDARPGEIVTAWNPINSPQCLAMPYTGLPALATTFEQHQICYNRELPFSRDQTSNYHKLDWDWQKTRSISDLSVIGPAFDKEAGAPLTRTTKVRVAWPMMGAPFELDDQVPPYDNDATFSAHRALSVTHLSPEMLPGPELPWAVIARDFPVMADDWIGPRSPVLRSGYALAVDPLGGRAALIGLGDRTPTAQDLKLLDFGGAVDLAAPWAGAGGGVDAALLGGAPGPASGIFLYQGPASPARLFVGVEAADDSPLELTDAEARFGTAVPEVHDARLVYASPSQELLLLGSPVEGGAPDQVWRLSLATGAWEGPVAPAALRGRRGFTAHYDPVLRRVVIFGGTKVGSGSVTSGDAVGAAVASADVVLLDPSWLGATVQPTTWPAGPGPARTLHGSRIVPERRALYVQGGTRDGVVHGDAWRLDLLTWTWQQLPGDGPAVTEPFVAYDPRADQLWVGRFQGTELRQGLRIFGRDRTGKWQETAALRVTAPDRFPVDDVLSSDQAGIYLWSPPEGTPLPGVYLLAQVTSAAGPVGVTLTAPGPAEVASGAAAGLLCPTGAQCTATVEYAGSLATGTLVPYQLALGEAALEQEAESSPCGSLADVAVSAGKLLVGGLGGLRTLDPTTLAETDRLGGPGMSGVTALMPCGSYVCVSRLGIFGLKVVDASRPGAPQVVSEALTLGLGWDVAVWGPRAYVAEGVLGVGIYDLSDPRAPRYAGRIPVVGLVRSVAVQGSRLAVGLLGGRVLLYELRDGPTRLGEVQVPGPLERIRFRGGRLWALRIPGHQVTVIDVGDPAAPAVVGSFDDEPEEFHARYQGVMRYAPDGPRLARYRLVAVSP